MEQVFIKSLRIDSVRHIQDVDIDCSSDDGLFKSIVFTGKNGSGKTSLLEAIAGYIDSVCNKTFDRMEQQVRFESNIIENGRSAGRSDAELYDNQQRLRNSKSKLEEARHGLSLEFNVPESNIYAGYKQGEYVFAFFEAQRRFAAVVAKQAEKVTFADYYGIKDSPGNLFIKYLLDLKFSQALAVTDGDTKRASEIQGCFDRIQDILRAIYEDESLTVEFDSDTFEFSINEEGRAPFGFNEASDGFSAMLDIVVGVMLRMVRGNGRKLLFDIPGIVIIDEVENHLHLSLQKKVVPMLCGLFPNIQFVFSTHSPFVLSSAANAVVYDLESRRLVKDGLADNTYESIVDGYYNVDRLSQEVRAKYNRYVELANKESLSEDEVVEAGMLEIYLDEIPDYLAFGLTTEYKKLKNELRSKVVFS